jgi:hypothetical protein
MDAKIDYVSWSVMHDPRERGDEAQMWLSCVNALWEAHPTFMQWAADVRGWSSGGARGHYQFSQFNAHEFAAVRFGGSANHVLIELPGTACQSLRDAGLLNQIVAEAAHRLTRLDMAIDIPGGCSPREFVAAGYNARFKSYAEIVSESGETEYVGSMKSERYARVYMYAPPHPRAGTLRVEHVLRSDYAKSAAEMLTSGGTLALAEACGNSFGWQSAHWQPEHVTDGKLRAQRSDRHEPGRVRWLYNVVAPAIVKAGREGLLDPVEFCARIIALSANNL